MAGNARLITVESRNATIDTITATTIARWSVPRRATSLPGPIGV